MMIDCDTCEVRGPACGDCVVSVLLGSPPSAGEEGAIELDGREQAAIAVLAGAGLVPPLRLVVTEEEPADGAARPVPGAGAAHERHAPRAESA